MSNVKTYEYSTKIQVKKCRKHNIYFHYNILLLKSVKLIKYSQTSHDFIPAYEDYSFCLFVYLFVCVSNNKKWWTIFKYLKRSVIKSVFNWKIYFNFALVVYHFHFIRIDSHMYCKVGKHTIFRKEKSCNSCRACF